MDTHNIVKYMQTRENGFGPTSNGYKLNICGDIFGRMACQLENLYNLDLSLGSTFCCKFSRNNNNLHVAACSTEKGEIVILNTLKNGLFNFPNGTSDHVNTVKESIHPNAIFNIAWADTKMKLVTASGDHTSKLIDVLPSGEMVVDRQFNHNSSVKSVMFCPGSSDVFCGGTLDGSIKVWDARVQSNTSVLTCSEHHIPNSHVEYNRVKKKFRRFGVSSVVFQNDQNVISSSSHNINIKVWDLRRSYRQVSGNHESLALKKFTMSSSTCCSYGGFTDLILNPKATLLYAIGTQNIIYCFDLESTKTTQLRSYSGHIHETPYSKICLTHDGRYLFSGCTINTGVIYSTDLPHIEKPVYQLNHDLRLPLHHSPPYQELSVSDWCADPATHPKLITSSDSFPLVWSALSNDIKIARHQFIKTPAGRSIKPFRSKICTVPIKLDAELEEKNKKQIEELFQNWDINDSKLVSNTDTTTPSSITPQDNLFTKTKLSSPTQISLQSSTASSSVQQIPAVTTPKSKKRKKSSLSPKSLIDHYLVTNKREKLDTVVED